MSAFGIEHGWIFKARQYKRDAKGRFSHTSESKPKNSRSDVRGPRLTEHEYEMESQSAADDMKQLTRSEGDEKGWTHWKEQLEIGRDYYDSIGEWELADDIDMAIMDSEPRHQRALQIKRQLDKFHQELKR